MVFTATHPTFQMMLKYVKVNELENSHQRLEPTPDAQSIVFYIHNTIVI